jgi:hypothetical protein
MGHAYFFADREPELRELIRHPDHLDRQLGRAACHGSDPDTFHPDDGQPAELVVARCTRCAARLACLALALRAEDPDARSGWYGGLGPADRDGAAAVLGLGTSESSASDRAVRAAQLRSVGWTVEDIATELGCSGRTVQRDLRTTDHCGVTAKSSQDGARCLRTAGPPCDDALHLRAGADGGPESVTPCDELCNWASRVRP